MRYAIWAILSMILLATFPPVGIISLISFCISFTTRNQREWVEQDNPTKTTPQIEDIERELDDIETSLNIITENEKVTPIWDIKPPEQ